MSEASSIKVLLLGQSGVGKSSLMLRFADGTFSDEQAATIGVDFRVKAVDVEGVGPLKLQVWDTAGQERFRTLTKSYYRGAAAIVFVHDVSAPETTGAVERRRSTSRPASRIRARPSCGRRRSATSIRASTLARATAAG